MATRKVTAVAVIVTLSGVAMAAPPRRLLSCASLCGGVTAANAETACLLNGGQRGRCADWTAAAVAPAKGCLDTSLATSGGCVLAASVRTAVNMRAWRAVLSRPQAVDPATPPGEPSVRDHLAEDERRETLSVEETPGEETPVEETPVEETPMEETPMETLVDETSVEAAPMKEIPVEETPVEETPVEEMPVEETPVEETPVEETPVEETPVEETPVEETPLEETPLEEALVEKTLVEETLVDETLVEDGPSDFSVDDQPTDNAMRAVRPCSVGRLAAVASRVHNAISSTLRAAVVVAMTRTTAPAPLPTRGGVDCGEVAATYVARCCSIPTYAAVSAVCEGRLSSA
ncbi:hypothetical protein MMPV_004344 [Pyropia vietnamensis]